ncbi:MAG TPA: DUF6178 family protein, partial [Vicinamibacterales bacterium]|nr:DUF6178 family protein [Vicinamibacterales bacterium]
MPKSELLSRILETPHIVHVVPRLQPEVIHKVIQNCGLEDCADIVALATPAQLMRVFDLDLWRSERAGLDERLDADRFGVWLEVLMESGTAGAAEKIIGMDVDLVIAALAQHMRVFDRAATSRSGREIATYVIEPVRTGSWDAIVELLIFLDAEHHDYFNRVIRGCRRVSS